MGLIDYSSVLGSKKVVVGDKSYGLVLANSGAVYILYGNTYKKFQDWVRELANSDPKFVIVDDAEITAEKVPSDTVAYNSGNGQLVYSDGEELKVLAETLKEGEQYLLSSGGEVTGELQFKKNFTIESPEVILNLNAAMVGGIPALNLMTLEGGVTVSGDVTFAGLLYLGKEPIIDAKTVTDSLIPQYQSYSSSSPMQVSITVDTENTVTEDAELMSLLLPEIGIYKVGFKFGMGDMQSSVLTLDARKLERDDVSQYTVHNILDHIAVDCETIGPVCLQGNHIFVTIPCRVKAQTVTILLRSSAAIRIPLDMNAILGQFSLQLYDFYCQKD